MDNKAGSCGGAELARTGTDKCKMMWRKLEFNGYFTGLFWNAETVYVFKLKTIFFVWRADVHFMPQYSE